MMTFKSTVFLFVFGFFCLFCLASGAGFPTNAYCDPVPKGSSGPAGKIKFKSSHGKTEIKVDLSGFTDKNPRHYSWSIKGSSEAFAFYPDNRIRRNGHSKFTKTIRGLDIYDF